MTVVLDASTAVKWFAREDGTEEALILLEGGVAFVAPEVLPLEVASTLLRKERSGLLPAGTALRALGEIDTLGVELLPVAGRLRRAVDLSMQHRHALYDCLYVAVATERRLPLATFDTRLAALAHRLAIPLWSPGPPP